MTLIPSPDEVVSAMSPQGGWTREQLAEWGVSWPPQRGWRRKLKRKWMLSHYPFYPPYTSRNKSKDT
jgi:hypothetical protein